MRQPAAVLGVGQTRHRSKRTDVSIAGLCREAADRASRSSSRASPAHVATSDPLTIASGVNMEEARARA